MSGVLSVLTAVNHDTAIELALVLEVENADQINQWVVSVDFCKRVAG